MSDTKESNPLQRLVELANFDRDFIDLNKKVKSSLSKITDFENQIKAIKAEFESEKTKLHDAQKTVHEQELVMKGLDDQLEQKKVLMDKISNQKEYNAVKSEIGHIKSEQHDYESSLIAEWNNLDNAKKSFASAEGSFGQKVADVEEKITQEKNNLESYRQSIQEKEDNRSSYLDGLPEEWLVKYQAMRQRVSDPIVPSQQGACSACFRGTTPQDVIDLKHKKLIQCKDCYRFLFFES